MKRMQNVLMRRSRFAIVLSLFTCQTYLRAEKLNLLQCYQLALQRDESIRVQAQKIVQADEAYDSARSAVLPKIQFNYSHSFQDTTGVEQGSTGVGGTLTRKERPEAKFSGSQNLFAGFREFAAMSALKSAGKKETFLLKNAGRDLFQKVAFSFYSALLIQKDLENVRTIILLTKERVKELEARVQLGKSRESEFLTLESQLANLEAQEEKIKGDILLEKESLTILTGKNLDDAELADEIIPVQKPEPLETYLQKAADRSELRALQAEMDSKKSELKAARGALFPTLSASGNYYTKRVGFQEPIDWDVLLSAQIPIFEGGKNLAALRNAASTLKETDLILKQRTKEIELDVRKKYILLNSSIQQLITLEKALSKAEESYHMQVKEYRLGLVNNLEVIQAMNMYQEARRNYNRALILTKLNSLELKIVIEELP